MENIDRDSLISDTHFLVVGDVFTFGGDNLPEFMEGEWEVVKILSGAVKIERVKNGTD